MRYNISLNQPKMLEWGINPMDGIVFAYLSCLQAWATHEMIGNDVYYFASRIKAIDEIPCVTDKPDTIYRIYKKLEKKGLVKYKKRAGKDLIKITAKGAKWNKFEAPKNSENFPNKLGKFSESVGKFSENDRKIFRISSENFPTYNNYNKDNKLQEDNTYKTYKKKVGVKTKKENSFSLDVDKKNESPPVAVTPPNDPRIVTLETNQKAEDILRHLNEITNSNFRFTRNSKRSILERLSEGFVFEEFQKVIEVKTMQWQNTDRAQWLRPSTLFGDNFESYLNLANQAERNPKILQQQKSNKHEPIISKESIESVIAILDGEDMYAVGGDI